MGLDPFRPTLVKDGAERKAADDRVKMCIPLTQRAFVGCQQRSEGFAVKSGQSQTRLDNMDY